jgi:hypothetical protein
MMPRYLIAKYAPDVRRMEPLNIGIILWTPKKIVSRFIAEEEASFVNDSKTYARWLRFWNSCITGDSIEFTRRNKTVSRSDPAFLDVLQETEKGNYLLFDGGFVEQKLKIREVADAVDFLFDELIAPTKKTRHPIDSSSHDPVAFWADTLFADAGISDRDDFVRGRKVQCAIDDGLDEEFTFNYALGNGEPHAVFHRVLLHRQQSVYGTSFMFEWVRKAITKIRCASLVYLENGDDKATRHKGTLGNFSQVINLAQPDRAKVAIAKLAR